MLISQLSLSDGRWIPIAHHQSGHCLLTLMTSKPFIRWNSHTLNHPVDNLQWNASPAALEVIASFLTSLLLTSFAISSVHVFYLSHFCLLSAACNASLSEKCCMQRLSLHFLTMHFNWTSCSSCMLTRKRWFYEHSVHLWNLKRL